MFRHRSFFQSSASFYAGAVTVTTLAVCLAADACAQNRPLNDSGQSKCYDTTNNAVAVNQADCGDASALPRQDARYGRDAQAAAGRLTKIGAGTGGFDFTKIANNGTALPATAALGSGPADWACTRDNVTGLIWEVKTVSGLQSNSHTYTWYSTDASANGGNVGTVGINTCDGSLASPPYNNQCNTQNFISVVNTLGLCGASDWRLPSLTEIMSLYHVGVSTPSIDIGYFPNTTNKWHWTSLTYAADTSKAWIFSFRNEPILMNPTEDAKNGYSYAILLVRNGR